MEKDYKNLLNELSMNNHLASGLGDALMHIALVDYQDANGRIADIIMDANWSRNALKPPIQGIALHWLLDNDPQLASVSPEDA